MSSREAILSSVRTALKPLETRFPHPNWDNELIRDTPNETVEDLWMAFARNLSSVNGTPLIGFDALGQWLSEKGCRIGYCDPQFHPRLSGQPTFAGIEFRTIFDRQVVDEYEFGITRASGAIAMTGTVVLKDEVTTTRLGALAPWIHIAVVTPDQLLPDLPTALADLGEDPSVIWATGPSKTADVEGILIEGAHGPGIQVVCLDA